MKVIIAPDSFKSTLSSWQVAQIISKYISDTNQQWILPASDGGEGFVDALVHATNGQKVHVNISNMFLEETASMYGIIHEHIAVMEVANIVGINMLGNHERDVLKASSFGVGEMISHIVHKGFKKIIIGLGGSATNDGGMGMLQGLGARFYNAFDEEIDGNCENLIHIARVDTTRCLNLEDVELIVACDVENKLCGDEGATAIFGKQKGVDEQLFASVEKGMQHYQRMMGDSFGMQKGCGAAGGMGAVLISFYQKLALPGAQVFMDYTGFCKHMEDADLLISGEGQMDGQTSYGKLVMRLCQKAKEYDVKTICFVGSLKDGYEKCLSVVDEIIEVGKDEPIEKRLQNPQFYLHEACRKRFLKE